MIRHMSCEGAIVCMRDTKTGNHTKTRNWRGSRNMCTMSHSTLALLVVDDILLDNCPITASSEWKRSFRLDNWKIFVLVVN